MNQRKPGDRFIHKRFLKTGAKPPYEESDHEVYVVTAVRGVGAGITVYHTTAERYDSGRHTGNFNFMLNKQSDHVLKWLPKNGMNQQKEIPRFGAEDTLY